MTSALYVNRSEAVAARRGAFPYPMASGEMLSVYGHRSPEVSTNY